MKRIDITEFDNIGAEPRGFLKKHWVKAEEKKLAKFNNNIYPDQDILEQMACRIHKVLGVETVEVQLIHHEEHGNGCMVKSFLKKDTEVLLELEKKPLIKNDDNETLNISKSFWSVYAQLSSKTKEDSWEDLRSNYNRIVMADCLLGNEDRDIGNLGIIYDEQTTEKRLTPAYDNGLIFNSFPVERDYYCYVGRNQYNAKGIINYLVKYAHDDVMPIIDNFVNGYDEIQTILNDYEKVLEPDKYIYIQNNLMKTHDYLRGLTNEPKARKL